MTETAMRTAYADPPYLGLAEKFYGHLHPIVRGGRPQAKRLHAVRDYCSTGISNNGFKGSKPDALIFWIFEVLNLEPTDEFHDLFPGSGAVTRAWEQWRDRVGVEQFSLLATGP